MLNNKIPVFDLSVKYISVIRLFYFTTRKINLKTTSRNSHNLQTFIIKPRSLVNISYVYIERGVIIFIWRASLNTRETGAFGVKILTISFAFSFEKGCLSRIYVCNPQVLSVQCLVSCKCLVSFQLICVKINYQKKLFAFLLQFNFVEK